MLQPCMQHLHTTNTTIAHLEVHVVGVPAAVPDDLGLGEANAGVDALQRGGVVVALHGLQDLRETKMNKTMVRSGVELTDGCNGVVVALDGLQDLGDCGMWRRLVVAAV